MRVIFHVRCHGEPNEQIERVMMSEMADVVDYPEKGWGILTIGRSYYHDNAICEGHPDVKETCEYVQSQQESGH